MQALGKRLEAYFKGCVFPPANDSFGFEGAGKAVCESRAEAGREAGREAGIPNPNPSWPSESPFLDPTVT